MIRIQKYDWDLIEDEISSIFAALPQNLQRDVIPGAYRPGTWKRSSSSAYKRPCLICQKIEQEMFILRPTVARNEVFPLNLCIEHFELWKNDTRTKDRLQEIRDKTAEKYRGAKLLTRNLVKAAGGDSIRDMVLLGLVT